MNRTPESATSPIDDDASSFDVGGEARRLADGLVELRAGHGEQPMIDPNDETVESLPLTQIPLFQDMEESAIRSFLGACEKIVVAPDDRLVRADDTSTDLYLIRRGYVEVTRLKNGRRVVVATLAPGDLVGEMNMLLKTGRTADVTALTDVEAYRIPERTFQLHFGQDVPELAQVNLNLARIAAARLLATTRLLN